MASSSSILVLITLMSMISLLTVPAQALIINGLPIAQVLTGGTALCPTAVAPGGTQNVIPNAPVQLVCGTGSTEIVLRSTTTDVRGVYSFSFGVADALLFDPATCFIRINIPPNTCTVPLPNGFLRVPFVVLSVVQNLPLIESLLGNLLVLVTGAVRFIV